jgi:curli biogenesis system outer membrane secretion channel CsgG
MSRNTLLFSVLAIVIGAPMLAGCGEEPATTIQLSYERPAQVQIPEKIKKLAVAEFGGKSGTEQRWGGIAADKLSAELEKANRTYNRYELVDRQNLARLLKEQDIQIMNSDQAIKFGKMANAQAMIFGNVTVNAHDERASRQQLDIVSRGMKTVYYTKRFVMVSVNLTMTDVDTAKTIHTFNITKEFDSDKESGSSPLGRMVGFSSDNPPAIDETVGKVVDTVVAEFAKQISPYRESISVKLENGKSDKVVTGNKLAKAGDYGSALETYKMAMTEHPDDDGAIFDSGVMYEAKGDFTNADNSYMKAFQVGSKDKYLEARKRVHVETKPEAK